jgi:hypothetical protein
MAMVVLLQACTGASDADAVHESIADARWRMVLDVLDRQGPAFSQGSLSSFRERLIAHDMDRRLLERTVELAKETGAFDPKQLRKTLRLMVDARPLKGAGRVEDAFNLLARAGKQLLVAACMLTGKDPARVAPQIGAGMLLGTSIKAKLDVPDWGDDEQKSEALARLTAAIDNVVAWVEARCAQDAQQPPVSKLLATVAKIREQNLEPEPPDGGGGDGGPRVRDGVARERLVSLSDPEMRHGRKSSSKTFSGYKQHIAAELGTDLILAVAVMPANRPEAEGFDAMEADIERVRADVPVAELHVDRGYVGATLTKRLVSTGARLISKPRTTRNAQGTFGRDKFRFNYRKKTVTCPAGQVATFTPGKKLRFDHHVCGPCPLRARCTNAAPHRPRMLSIAKDEEQQSQLRRLMSTVDGRAAVRERTAVEHRLAHLAQKQGPRARYLGQRKNLFDARRHAAVLNLETCDRSLRQAA